MKKQMTFQVRKWAVLSICGAIVIAAAGAGGAGIATQYFVQGGAATQIIVLPGGNANTDGNIARLNTRTGAIYRYRGDIDNPSTRGTWELRVPAVKGETSGFMEIQRIANAENETVATFLVDIVTGATWVLHQRASTNASWDPINAFH